MGPSGAERWVNGACSAGCGVPGPQDPLPLHAEGRHPSRNPYPRAAQACTIIGGGRVGQALAAMGPGTDVRPPAGRLPPASSAAARVALVSRALRGHRRQQPDQRLRRDACSATRRYTAGCHPYRAAPMPIRPLRSSLIAPLITCRSHQVVVGRGGKVDGPPGPIIVATRNDALDGIVDATPEARRKGARGWGVVAVVGGRGACGRRIWGSWRCHSHGDSAPPACMCMRYYTLILYCHVRYTRTIAAPHTYNPPATTPPPRPGVHPERHAAALAGQARPRRQHAGARWGCLWVAGMRLQNFIRRRHLG